MFLENYIPSSKDFFATYYITFLQTLIIVKYQLVKIAVRNKKTKFRLIFVVITNYNSKQEMGMEVYTVKDAITVAKLICAMNATSYN